MSVCAKKVWGCSEIFLKGRGKEGVERLSQFHLSRVLVWDKEIPAKGQNIIV